MHISDVHAGYGPGLDAAAPLRRVGGASSSPTSSRSPATSSRAAARLPGFAAAAAELVAVGPPRRLRRRSATTTSRAVATRSRRAGTPATSAASTLLDGTAAEVTVNGRRISIAGASAARLMKKRGVRPVGAPRRGRRPAHPALPLPGRCCRACATGWAHLVLAGHLHGGQICIPWPGGRVGLAHPRSGTITALESCNGTVMHVSPGLGTTFVPFRLFAQPEVTLLRLRPA